VEQSWKTFIRLMTGTARVLAAGALLCCGGFGAGAQVEVVKGKHSFGVSGFAGDAAIAGQVADVLKNDLQLSG